MNTRIHLTLEKFGNLLHLPPGGNYDDKGPFNCTFFIEFGFASELNIHDHVLYLIMIWNLHPIKKHAKLRNTDYWWLDSVHSNRRPDLALIMRLGISTFEDSPISSNQPISYEALHHASYHYDANFGEWIKNGHSTANENDNVKGAFEDILASKHVPPLGTSSRLFNLLSILMLSSFMLYTL
ncbi:hypothetical protein J1N35_001144 [Gossypium stocksii]|uniref:Uncharacterized protein n=1 Tax=Gossypium stocksii TaxID=47602 RepID=A0A9D4AL23_9ROSI|nr:hypothetical protein J1N35_001144 [Gossypium stocksii]